MKTIDRFLSKIHKESNKCWSWTASKTRQGYGMFSHLGKSIPAHRFSYIHHTGDIPTGYIVHQICQNNCCFNPVLLILCTKSESRLEYNSTRIHPDAKKLIDNIKKSKSEPINDFGFSSEN
jgi:hypothetical protein